jgi:hypothetical protein
MLHVSFVDVILSFAVPSVATTLLLSNTKFNVASSQAYTLFALNSTFAVFQAAIVVFISDTCM